MASSERHLQRKGHSASIINDLVFENQKSSSIQAKTAEEARFDKQRIATILREEFAWYM